MAKTNPAVGHKLLDNQVFRFIMSAGVGFVIDMAAFDILFYRILESKTFNILGINASKYQVAFTLAFSLGVLVNFLITRFLVFSESQLSPGTQFFRFAGVATLGYFANLGILTFLIEHFKIAPAIARPAAALSLFFASFFVHKLFSFNLSLRPHAPRKHN